MPTTIESLPPEIRAGIFKCLNHASLTQLMRTNKALHEEVEPLVWKTIELHRPGYHQYYQYEEEFHSTTNLERHLKRPYHFPNSDSYCHEDEYYRQDEAYCLKAFQFMKVFDESAASPAPEPLGKAQHLALAAKVRFLCLTFDFYHDDSTIEAPWSVFPLFVNLEQLELTAHWPYDTRQWDSALTRFTTRDYAPLPRLHTLHLTGYIPSELVRYFCANASTVKDLELALLDRPVGSTLYENRKNPPPGHDESSSNDDDGSDSDTDDGSTESSEDFDHEETAPRALAALLDNDNTGLINNFTSLTHLTLRRPAQSTTNVSRDSFRESYFSPISEHRILQEWAQLIRTSRDTIEHLVLDQRPFAEIIEQDSTNDKEFLELYPWGPGYWNFAHRVLPVLLDDETEWPRLKSMRLYGFDLPESVQRGIQLPSWFGSRPRVGETLLEKLGRRFGPLGMDVGCGLGRRMLYEGEDGVVRRGDGFGGTNRVRVMDVIE